MRFTIRWFVIRWFVMVLILVGAGGGARATTEYAQREGKACQYCHVSSSPGIYDPVTKRKEPLGCNVRGVYYQRHNYSFEGWVENRIIPFKQADLFHAAWRATLPANTRRIAVADTVGDGSVRLITLSEIAGKPESSLLTVRKWDGKTFASAFIAEVPGAAKALAVGKFAGVGHPAIIVTGGAVLAWDGKTYAQKPASIPLLGMARLHDGGERVLFMTKTDVQAAQIELTAGGGNALLASPTAAPDALSVRWSDLHLNEAIAEKLNIPPALSQAGLFGVWDIRQTGSPFVYRGVNDRAFEFKQDAADKNLSEPVLKEKYCRVAFDYQERAGDKQPHHWETPNLPGEILDIVLQSAKGEATPGILILTSESGDPKEKGRGLYFFTLG